VRFSLRQRDVPDRRGRMCASRTTRCGCCTHAISDAATRSIRPTIRVKIWADAGSLSGATPSAVGQAPITTPGPADGWLQAAGQTLGLANAAVWRTATTETNDPHAGEPASNCGEVWSVISSTRCKAAPLLTVSAATSTQISTPTSLCPGRPAARPMGAMVVILSGTAPAATPGRSDHADTVTLDEAWDVTPASDSTSS